MILKRKTVRRLDVLKIQAGKFWGEEYLALSSITRSSMDSVAFLYLFLWEL